MGWKGRRLEEEGDGRDKKKTSPGKTIGMMVRMMEGMTNGNLNGPSQNKEEATGDGERADVLIEETKW